MNEMFKSILQSNEFREEHFVAHIQAGLAQMLEDKGVSRAELARKLGVSRARVTQIFSDDANNFTLRLLARSYLALDEEPVILTRSEYERLSRDASYAIEKPGGSVRQQHTSDALTASVIAELLRASEVCGDQDKSSRRADSAEEWARAGLNVVPLRKVSNG